ncbi:hypothetical protein ABHN11_12890 [Brevibacillus centrosporus]|uniref:hypothetical protein n=1 Tax=Brevibacillus centrosporus TaxID=54910 RepID=UPI003D1CA167
MNLVPAREPQAITFQQFKDALPPQGFEFAGEDLYWSDDESKRCVLMIVTTIGLEQFTKMLPKESRKMLKEILRSNQLHEEMVSQKGSDT